MKLIFKVRKLLVTSRIIIIHIHCLTKSDAFRVQENFQKCVTFRMRHFLHGAFWEIFDPKNINFK